MGIVTIDSVKTTDTFEKQRTQINSGLTKLNKIDLDSEVLTISESVEPANSTIEAGSFRLYMDSTTGDIKIKLYKTDGSVKTVTLVDESAV